MRQQIDAARRHGVAGFLAAPMICGVFTFHALEREHRDGLFMAHPALAGADAFAPPLLLGRLFRLFGADAMISPNYGGRFAYAAATCQALPVPAAGMGLERVPNLVREYGPDAVLVIGGSRLIARDHLAQRSRAFVEAVAAAAGEAVQ
jgi:ribulose-bisphosphate carboxylase large chain